jgi:hypothetical protein
MKSSALLLPVRASIYEKIFIGKQLDFRFFFFAAQFINRSASLSNWRLQAEGMSGPLDKFARPCEYKALLSLGTMNRLPTN